MTLKKVVVLPLVLGKDTDSLPCLAMGMLASYLRIYDSGILNDSYDIERLLPGGCENMPLKAIYKKVVQSPDPVCLFSSYVWNEKINLKVAKHIKQISPNSLIVFGGPHVPKFDGDSERFLQDNPFIDIAVLGEGEVALAEILAAFAGSPRGERNMTTLDSVTGIVFSSNDAQSSRTAERQRIRDICDLPSPYLTGEFEPWFQGFRQAVLETNRGCPYGCTYCDWGSATLAKVTKFTPARVIEEIEYIAKKETESIFLADANFGMLEQDIEIATALVEIRKRTGYPLRLFTNFAKNGGRRLMEVTKILHDGGLLPTGIIALQTTDPTVLKAIARDNIKTEAYEKMMTYFNSEKIPMSSDLMIGLPGQTIESFATDLQFCFDWKVSATGNYTSLMPNAPMAERRYKEQHEIVAGDDDMIQSTASFTAADMDYMKRLYTMYQFNVRFGVLKYILYFLQVEREIPAIKFLDRLLRSTLASDQALPLSMRILDEIFGHRSQHRDWAVLLWEANANFLFDDPEAYYQEVFEFAEREFDVIFSESEIDTLKRAQQAVMPRIGRSYPYEVLLDHDMEQYVGQIKETPSLTKLDNAVKHLSDFPPSKLVVSAETGALSSTDFQTMVSHDDKWELESPLRFY